ncbi:MAG: SGNH/GDSL hydrolase family protein [Myxococcota bacterium]|nr:SGNH/GDSL hydrolase family protein [Myxococcota bacterium]
MVARSRSRWLLRFGLLLGSLLLVLVVAEVFIRIVIYNREQAVAAESTNPHPELPVLNGMFELGRKNVRGTHKGVFFRTNSQRIRGPEYPRQAAEDLFRIAVAGDSVTMGEGVEESLAYPARLAEMIEPLVPGQRVEVINVGLSGSNIRFAMDRLEDAVDFYDPDLIVYGFTINDIEGPNYKAPTRKTEELRELQSNRFFTESPLISIRLIWWLLVTSDVPGSDQKNWYAEELLYNYFENESARADWDRGLDRFRNLAREHEVCSHVLIHTHLNELDEDHPYLPIYQLVHSEADERGLPVTSTFADFEGADPLALRLNFIDPHPNAEGHALMAEALARGLSGLPVECWRRGGDAE